VSAQHIYGCASDCTVICASCFERALVNFFSNKDDDGESDDDSQPGDSNATTASASLLSSSADSESKVPGMIDDPSCAPSEVHVRNEEENLLAESSGNPPCTPVNQVFSCSAFRRAVDYLLLPFPRSSRLIRRYVVFVARR